MPIDIPSWKDPKARKVYIVLGSAAGGFVIYRWWQNRNAATVTDSTLDTGSVTDAAGGGAPAEGNVQYGGADITTYGDQTPTTNDAWARYATELMVANGWEPTTVQAALGKFLTRTALTTTEETIVRAAIGIAGTPPVGAFEIIHSTAPDTTPGSTDDDDSDSDTDSTGSGGSGSGGGGGSSSGGGHSGGKKPKKEKLGFPYGFRNVTVTKNSATVGWNAVPGATGYEVYREFTGNSTKVGPPTASFTGLKQGAVYRYKVRAYNNSGPGPWSAQQWFRTQG